jgi:hypothetical protein
MSCTPCRYAYNIARWLDQGINAATGGDPRQTLSSRLGRAEAAGVAWAVRACRVLGWLWRDPAHCAGAVRAADNEMEVLDIDGPGDGP